MLTHAPREIAWALAPASIGNIGPGLDVLGMAVTGPGDRVRAGDPLVFHPASPIVPIQFEGGRYPILFAGSSHATWVEPAPSAAVAPASPANTPASHPIFSASAKR